MTLDGNKSLFHVSLILHKGVNILSLSLYLYFSLILPVALSLCPSCTTLSQVSSVKFSYWKASHKHYCTGPYVNLIYVISPHTLTFHLPHCFFVSELAVEWHSDREHFIVMFRLLTFLQKVTYQDIRQCSLSYPLLKGL